MKTLKIISTMVLAATVLVSCQTETLPLKEIESGKAKISITQDGTKMEYVPNENISKSQESLIYKAVDNSPVSEYYDPTLFTDCENEFVIDYTDRYIISIEATFGAGRENNNASYYFTSSDIPEFTVIVYDLNDQIIYSETFEDFTGEFLGITSLELFRKIVFTTYPGYEDIPLGEVGWKRCIIPNQDSDGDGCPDEDDSVVDSNMEPVISIDGCSSGVMNEVTLSCGVMMADELDALIEAEYRNHGLFIKEIAKLMKTWISQGLISEAEKDAIIDCAANSSLHK